MIIKVACRIANETSNLKSKDCPFIVVRIPINHFQIIPFFLLTH